MAGSINTATTLMSIVIARQSSKTTAHTPSEAQVIGNHLRPMVPSGIPYPAASMQMGFAS
jgi:hypothetical protein